MRRTFTAASAMVLSICSGCIFSSETRVYLKQPDTLGLKIERNDNTENVLFEPTSEPKEGIVPAVGYMGLHTVKYFWTGEKMEMLCSDCVTQQQTLYDRENGLYFYDTEASTVIDQAKSKGAVELHSAFNYETNEGYNSRTIQYLDTCVYARTDQISKVKESTRVNDNVAYYSAVPFIGGLVLGALFLASDQIPLSIASFAGSALVFGGGLVFLFWSPQISEHEVQL